MYELYANFPADDEFWRHPTADPGVENLFGSAVYDRGALALHTLRLAVGDATFFRILKTWVARHKYGNVTTSQFTALAERISGRDLDALFTTWLYTDGKPAGFEPPPESRLTATARRDLAERFGVGKSVR